MHYDGLHLVWANRRMHTRNVVFGEVMYEPGGMCGPRVQRDYELVIVHSGQCRVTVDETHRELQVDRVYLFLPGHREHFQFSSERQTHHSYCSVRPGFMPRGMCQRLRRGPEFIACSKVFRHLLAAAFELRIPQDSASSLLLDHLGLCAFSEFLSSARQADTNTSQDPALAAFLRYVEDNFGKQECLQEAHRAARISRNALIVKFRTRFNSTPGRYLWRFRAERGAAMLRETGHTAAEISYVCGFKNPFHFCRVIKQYFGLCPKSLRQQAWSSGALPAATSAKADSCDCGPPLANLGPNRHD